MRLNLAKATLVVVLASQHSIRTTLGGFGDLLGFFDWRSQKPFGHPLEATKQRGILAGLSASTPGGSLVFGGCISLVLSR